MSDRQDHASQDADYTPKRNKHGHWMKGSSGHPGGRPVGESISACLLRELSKDDSLQAIAVAKALIARALHGEDGVPAARIILDRTEGPVMKHPSGDSLAERVKVLLLGDKPKEPKEGK